MFVSVSAVAEAARYVERQWGEGYYVEGVEGHGSVVVLAIVCGVDGSRFAVASDRYGAVVVHADTPAEAGRAWIEAKREHAAYHDYRAACEDENLDAHPREAWKVHGCPTGPLGSTVDV